MGSAPDISEGSGCQKRPHQFANASEARRRAHVHGVRLCNRAHRPVGPWIRVQPALLIRSAEIGGLAGEGPGITTRLSRSTAAPTGCEGLPGDDSAGRVYSGDGLALSDVEARGRARARRSRVLMTAAGG